MFIDKNDPKKRFTVYLQRCLTHITSVCSTFDNMMEEDEKILGCKLEKKKRRLRYPFISHYHRRSMTHGHVYYFT